MVEDEHDRSFSFPGPSSKSMLDVISTNCKSTEVEAQGLRLLTSGFGPKQFLRALSLRSSSHPPQGVAGWQAVSVSGQSDGIARVRYRSYFSLGVVAGAAGTGGVTTGLSQGL